MKCPVPLLIFLFSIHESRQQILDAEQPPLMPLPDLLYVISPFFQRVDYEKQETCEPEVGCFRKDGPFNNPVHRPVNVLPQTREQINTTFYLYTRRNPFEPQLLEKNIRSLSRSHFRREKPTKILIHGYLYNHIMGRYQQETFHRLITAFLLAGDYNVILCDWGEGSTTWYFQASANSRTVGIEIALLMEFLSREAKVPGKDFHLLGHSLGAHIAAYAGQRFKGLGRITGLDPARPYFEATHRDVRLDPGDALYVDVLHTDASLNRNDMFSLGTRQLMGDIDFFPNNGDHQPGCDREPVEAFLDGRGMIPSVRHLMTCDHRRSVDLLASYLEERNNRHCVPLAYKCKSWVDYENGNCYKCGSRGENCAIVGEPKVSIRKEREDTDTRYPYYIKTTANSPLCAHQYRVEFSLMQPIPSSKLWISVSDRTGHKALGEMREREWRAGTTYAFVMASETQIKEIQGVRVGSEEPIHDSSMSLTTDEDGPQVKHALITPLNEWSDQEKMRLSLRVCDFTASATRTQNSC